MSRPWRESVARRGHGERGTAQAKRERIALAGDPLELGTRSPDAASLEIRRFRALVNRSETLAPQPSAAGGPSETRTGAALCSAPECATLPRRPADPTPVERDDRVRKRQGILGHVAFRHEWQRVPHVGADPLTRRPATRRIGDRARPASRSVRPPLDPRARSAALLDTRRPHVPDRGLPSRFGSTA